MNKLTTVAQALRPVTCSMTIMLGGFFWSGSPFSLIAGLTERAAELGALTLISSDAGSAMGKPASYGNALLETGIFKKCVGSFLGHNHAAMRLAAEGRLELEIVPMGTFAERIRIGGAGIGGFLTPAGIGTEVAEGKETLCVDGTEYLLEKPLKADVALIYGSKVDENGNVCSYGTARNFNTVMAAAADYVVVEAREIVKAGAIDPSAVTIPAPFIDAIVPAREALYEAML